jgi:hypothetical protein
VLVANNSHNYETNVALAQFSYTTLHRINRHTRIRSPNDGACGTLLKTTSVYLFGPIVDRVQVCFHLPPRIRWGLMKTISALIDGASYNPTHLTDPFIAESTAPIFKKRRTRRRDEYVPPFHLGFVVFDSASCPIHSAQVLAHQISTQVCLLTAEHLASKSTGWAGLGRCAWKCWRGDNTQGTSSMKDSVANLLISCRFDLVRPRT